MHPSSPLPAPRSQLHVRWGIYLLLIAIAVGNMTGRLLSVNSVDKVQLEATRIKDRLSQRAQATDRGRRVQRTSWKPAWLSKRRACATSCGCSGRS